MTTLMAETRTKRRTTRPQPKNKPTPAPAQADTTELVVRRCCSCGVMSTIGDGLALTETLTLDGVTHDLAVCTTNGTCSYNAAILRDKLEFRDVERVHINPTPERFVMREFTMTSEDFNFFQDVCNSIRTNRQIVHPGEVLTDDQCIAIMVETYNSIPSHNQTEG